MSLMMNRRMRQVPPPAPQDYGKRPYVTDLVAAAVNNRNYRTAIWTGQNLQMTLMSIGVNQDVGLELHDDVDQFLYVVRGSALVMMGDAEDNLTFQQPAAGGYGIFVPMGTWHNVVNRGREPLKLFTVYAPPHHPAGTVEVTAPGE
ncbi:MAG: cupin domain-containing protein [Clostridiales bacterium]|jgi:mannose-6-phosphate isomerase-like protein (cupin superfamily)|nr:cupin domain-containing protein [Clostridiales bacterium]